MSNLTERRRVSITLARHTASIMLGIFAALVSLAIFSGASAHATIPTHARLTHADPAPDAVLNTAPTKITLQFAEDMKPADSTIIVYDVAGKTVSTGPATVSSTAAKTMTVGMQGNDSEVYVVVWRNVSAQDGDPDAGAYSFTVSKGATPSPGHQPGESSSPTSTASGVTPLIAALIGIAALVIGAAGGFFFARGQRGR